MPIPFLVSLSQTPCRIVPKVCQTMEHGPRHPTTGTLGLLIMPRWLHPFSQRRAPTTAYYPLTPILLKLAISICTSLAPRPSLIGVITVRTSSPLLPIPSSSMAHIITNHPICSSSVSNTILPSHGLCSGIILQVQVLSGTGKSWMGFSVTSWINGSL